MKFRVKIKHNEHSLHEFYDTQICDSYQEAEERVKTLQKEAPRALRYYTLSIEEIEENG